MDIIEYLKEESAKFNKVWRRFPDRRCAWNGFKEKAVTQFESICTEARTQKLLEYLYVGCSINNQNEQIKPPSYLTLYWDKRPTGELNLR
jgi:hypothetical protein